MVEKAVESRSDCISSWVIAMGGESLYVAGFFSIIILRM